MARQSPIASANGKRKRVMDASDRFASINRVLDIHQAELSNSAFRVWLMLWRDSRDGVARTSQKDLARRSGLDVRTIRRGVRQLEETGLVKVVRIGRLRQGPSQYRVLAP